MADVRKIKNPKSLYNLCIHVITENFKGLRSEVKCLPPSIMCDIYYKLFDDMNLAALGPEFSDLNVFVRVLRTVACHTPLHKCFQTLEEYGAELGNKLCAEYKLKATASCDSPCTKNKLDIIDAGLLLGGFLSDAAWYDKAEAVLLNCQEVCGSLQPTPLHLRLKLHCCQKLLRVQSLFCNLNGAQLTYDNILVLINDLKSTDSAPNLSGIYGDISSYFFLKSEYDNAFRFSLLALHDLKPTLPARVMVDVLRQASKTFVVKREFAKAGILGRQAVDLAAKIFGLHHPIYADAQINYGFFLLTFDSIHPCVQVYESALKIRKSVFKKNNINVAVALEELAYALYVREYTSGRFDEARAKADEAIKIKEKLLPKDHIMNSTAKSVKALILEEIALGSTEVQSKQKLLADAEAYHVQALSMSMKVYGEKNLQTAKYYGNLGRLCQTMERYEESEKMQMKAISVKEELLGPDHFEVGLSVGHLASLYNYHMAEYHKAKDLYLRSISIGLKIFGSSYCSLEYDYRGLVHVYTNLNDPEKAAECSELLSSWKLLRQLRLEIILLKFIINQPPKPILQVVREILSPKHIQASFSAL